MVEALGLLFLVFFFGAIFFALIAGPRWYSKWWLERRVYQHVDDWIGAKRFEAEYAATQRNLWGKYEDDQGRIREKRWAQWLWPHPELSGTMVRPHWWRRRQYVQITLANRPWPQVYFKKDIEAVTITWTSEVRIHSGTHNFWVGLEQQVAQALSIPWTEDTFVHNQKEFPYSNGLYDHRPDRDQVTLEVAEPLGLPARVSAEDELNGRLGTPGAPEVQ